MARFLYFGLPGDGNNGIMEASRKRQGDLARIGFCYAVDLKLTGDARATLQALLPLIQRHDDQSFVEKAQERVKEVS